MFEEGWMFAPGLRYRGNAQKVPERGLVHGRVWMLVGSLRHRGRRPQTSQPPSSSPPPSPGPVLQPPKMPLCLHSRPLHSPSIVPRANFWKYERSNFADTSPHSLKMLQRIPIALWKHFCFSSWSLSWPTACFYTTCNTKMNLLFLNSWKISKSHDVAGGNWTLPWIHERSIWGPLRRRMRWVGRFIGAEARECPQVPSGSAVTAQLSPVLLWSQSGAWRAQSPSRGVRTQNCKATILGSGGPPESPLPAALPRALLSGNSERPGCSETEHQQTKGWLYPQTPGTCLLSFDCIASSLGDSRLSFKLANLLPNPSGNCAEPCPYPTQPLPQVFPG